MDEKSPRVTVRIRTNLLQRVDAYAASLEIEAPGQRAIAIRKLIALGLRQVEQKK